MKISSLVPLALAGLSCAHLTSHKFPGYGFSWYNPVCGYACYNIISGAMLSCSTMEHMAGMSHMMTMTSPDCYANDESFLTTLAYCMASNCDNATTPVWKREKFWSMAVTGDMSVLPKWDYTTAVEMVKSKPTVQYNSSSEETLNQTQAVSHEDYHNQAKFMVLFDYLEGLQAKYIFVLFGVALGLPILLTYVTMFPFATTVIDKLKPYLVYPSTIGTYSVRPLPWLLGNPPTIGQAIYIAIFVILSLILNAVNFSSSQPHPWGFTKYQEIASYVGYRSGHIAYGILPLVMLFAGRNNFLLWITNWSYSTYLLIHRWIARVFTILAVVHSIALLACYKSYGTYAEESKMPYWYWGIVATVLACAMLVLSSLYFRRLAYEVFLILHILMAVFVLVGCWYHALLRFEWNWYENWLMAAAAVWFFDRLIRFIRVAKNGLRRATVTEIGPEHVRIDVHNVRWASKPGYTAYAYFPTLKPFAPWENHPFSVNSTAIFRSYKHALAPSTESLSHSSSDESRDVEKSEPRTVATASHRVPAAVAATTNGVTLIVKKNAGITKLLKSNSSLLTMIDGPYGHTPSKEILKCDHVLLIGGGIGIMGLVAWLHAHPNAKLAWSLKESASALVQEMDVVLRDTADTEIRIGERLNIDALLRQEAEAGYGKVGVVVCGPGGMCDEVRAKIAGIGRGSKTVFELEVDAFSW